MTIADDSRQPYMLATGNDAADRLRLLHKIFGSSSRKLLKAAGISPGMRIAEIGCGSGLNAIWLARTVGATGSVTAVDSSDEQLQLARKNAASAGLKNVFFCHADAYHTGLPRGAFDLVYSRFLLCHLAKPRQALSEMCSLLKPGGILACEDHDDGGIFTEPPTRAYQRLVEISRTLNQSRGLDSYIGLKLPHLFQQAGLTDIHLRVLQFAFLRGEEKRFWELTLREAAPAILDAGASTPEELESICDEMRGLANDESVLLMLARVTQVWAKP